jgi:hypothetical protein
VVRIVLGIGLLIGFFLFLKYFNSQPPQKRKRVFAWFVFFLLFGFVIFLTLTGRLNFIAAIVTGLLPFVGKAAPLLRYIPLLRRLVKSRKSQKDNTNEFSGKQNTVSAKKMTRSEAEAVLGLQTPYSKEDVVAAHRALIQKVHPDRGGNDYLAAQLNTAKDFLFDELA